MAISATGVTVRVPVYHGFNELVVLGEGGEELGIVRPQEEYSYHDARGAKRTASRVKQRNRAIAKLDRSAPDVDVGSELAAFGKEQPPVLTNEPHGRVSIPRRGSSASMIMSEVLPEKSREDARREADEIFEIQQRMFGRSAG